MKSYFKRGLVLGIIFLFLGAGVIPTISVSIEDNDTLLVSNSLPPPPYNYTIYLLGFMKFLNETTYYGDIYTQFEVTRIGLMIVFQDGNFAGFQPLQKNYIFWVLEFKGFKSSFFVFGTCKNILY